MARKSSSPRPGLALATLFLLAAPASSWAAHPYITDDTGTQGTGNWQLELLAEHDRNARTADPGGFAYYLRDDVRLVGEAGVRTNGAKDDPHLPGSNGQFAMLGAIYSPTGKIDLDVGFRKSLNHAELDWTILVGATFRW